MKKIIVFSIFQFIVFNVAHSQSTLNLEHVNMYNSSVIKPTWSNLTQMLFSDIKLFKSTMIKYNYSLTSKGDAYIANTSLGSPYFTITKSNDDISMIFTSNSELISSFKTELRQRLKGGNVSFENGFEVYRVQYEYDGFQYRIKIALTQEQNGSGMVSLILQ